MKWIIPTVALLGLAAALPAPGESTSHKQSNKEDSKHLSTESTESTKSSGSGESTKSNGSGDTKSHGSGETKSHGSGESKSGGSETGSQSNIIPPEQVKNFDYRVGLETFNGENRYVAWVGGQSACDSKVTLGKGDTAWCQRDSLLQYQGQYIKVRFHNCEALNPHSTVSDEEKSCPTKEEHEDKTHGESDKCMREKSHGEIKGVYLTLLDADESGEDESKSPRVDCGDLRETFQCGPAQVVTRLQCSPSTR